MRTPTFILIISGVVVLAPIIGGIFFFTQKKASTDVQNIPTQGNGFPIDTSSNSAAPLQVKTASGAIVQTQDVRGYSDTTSIGDGNYVVGDAEAANAPYQIIFFESDSSYLISLLREPLGSSRKIAEGELLQRLGVSKADACKLPIRVSTTVAVSDTLGGRELGLSFCPGSIAF